MRENYQKFASFVVTADDAREYLYSRDPKRRVQKWTDFRLDLFI